MLANTDLGRKIDKSEVRLSACELNSREYSGVEGRNL